MEQTKRIRISHAKNNAAVVHNGPDGDNQSSPINGNKSTPPRSASKNLARQKKLKRRAEDDITVGERILRCIKVCVICGNSNEVVDLSANPIMKETMSSYCGDDVDLDNCLSSVCITCVFKSRAVKDFQNKCKLRLKDFSNGHAIKNNHSNAKIEYNYGGEQSSERLDAEEKSFGKEEFTEINSDVNHRPNRVNGVFEVNNYSPARMRGVEGSNSEIPLFPVEHKSIIQLDYKNYSLTDITGDYPRIQHVESINTALLSSHKTDFLPISSSMVSSCSNSTHSQNGLSHSMLQVIRERPESVLVTESGGKINNYQSKKGPQTQRLCQYCGNSYIRKDHYNKHVRRCRHKSAHSLPPTTASNAENTKQFNAKRIRTNGIGNHCTMPITQIEEPQKKRTRKFHCSECSAIMDNVTELRKHRITHMRQYKCNMCKKDLTTLYEYDFHRTICLAENQVRLEVQEEARFQKETALNCDNKSVAKSERSIFTRRITRAQSRVRTQVIKTPKPTTTKAMLSRISKRRMTVLTSVSKYISANYSDSSNDDDNDDDVSVADSMDARRRIYTDDWLEKRYTNEVYETPAKQTNIGKEYDLILLERLKTQVKAQEFTCLVENCGFFADSLLNLMLHDYVHHFKASWFYCRKCGSVFTSKVFLDYHLDRQNGGRYICYKCNEQFMFQHQLDSHLILHTKHINHACTKCKCEYLSQTKLYQHMKTEHNNESEKKLIHIQSIVSAYWGHI
ncbi:zinc finger protein 888 isoform X2 [Eurosta solidaginis]|uniref:zinc finger protein 888 isoform X2 n=1 Tax=Eurosta solidaginis TaxID=178769 RepID=UPI0035312D60